MTDVRQGKALITGASTGIGAIYAERLARRGYDLVLVARDAVRLAALADRLSRETSASVEFIAADLTDPGQLGTIEARLADDQEITILVNNAGVAMDGTLATASPGQVETLIALNVLAPALLARSVARRFAVQRRGAIINIASVMALMPEAIDGTYSGTKAFLLNLSLGLAAQLQPLGVRIQAVLPGNTRTDIWAKSGKDVDTLPPDSVMSAEDLVDAALAGFDKGETVTIPPLQDGRRWEEWNEARLAMAPHLAARLPAKRYLAGAA